MSAKGSKKKAVEKAPVKKAAVKKAKVAVIKTQDPKYVIIDGKICNEKTKKAIPANEPVFMIRGKDKNATKTIAFYASLCINPEHRLSVLERCGEFSHFAGNNASRMRDADS